MISSVRKWSSLICQAYLEELRRHGLLFPVNSPEVNLATCLWSHHNSLPCKLGSSLLCPSEFRMREISFLRLSQNHLPCVWSRADLSAWKTEMIWAKGSLYFGNESTRYSKRAATVARYPESPFPSQHGPVQSPQLPVCSKQLC